MKQPHRARWGFSVGPTGKGGPELGLDDHVKGIEWTVDWILVGDFSIWPTFKEKEKEKKNPNFFFFCHLLYFPVVSVCSFCFQVHVGIQNYHMNNRKSWFTTFLHCNYLFKFYQSCCQQDLYSSFSLGILLKFVIPSSYCPFMCVW